MNTQTVENVKATSKNFISNQIDERSTAVGTQIASTADNLRTIGGNLRSATGAEPAADLANRIADYVERFGAYLRDSDSDRLLADVEQFSRERPWAVATGALIAGFAASRFIKSSSTLRYRSTQSDTRDFSSSSARYGNAAAYGQPSASSSYGTSYGTSYGAGDSDYARRDAGYGTTGSSYNPGGSSQSAYTPGSTGRSNP